MSEKNYKDTLLLPKTEFPMKGDLVKREPLRLEKWNASQLYQRIQTARAAAPLFVLHDGPPFANGDVHMGTALNKILKDLIVKSRTMLGFRAPFVPGWDCHGLPIEFKVVKEQKGLAPAEIRRRAEEFARKYIDIQRGQFRRLGVLGDWENPYLTLTPGYEAEIIRAFGGFVEKGLVYQSKKPVYWSTGAQTALAEAEVEYAQRTDPAIFVKFKVTAESAENFSVQEPASFVIWTTTPWTLPANVAIAVNPKQKYWIADFRHKETGTIEKFIIADSPQILENFEAAAGFTLVKTIRSPEELATWKQQQEARDAGYYSDEETGLCVDGFCVFGELLTFLTAQHPFLPRTSKIVTADFVTMETGTGQVHIAPGHGKDDYICGMQNGLPVLSPVDDYGKLTDECGVPAWVGKYVFDANAEIVADLRATGALLAEQKYTHDYPHCWRSKTPIVFRAVEQFFINVEKLRARALEAIGEVTWLPHWGRNRIYGTVEARPDWCISRQRTWGVPLPVFYTEKGEPIVDAAIARKVADLVESGGTNLWFEKDDAWWAAAVGLPAGTSRRNDTLDVWIDSGVSHTAVTAKNPALAETGGVADVYLEATDQHRGWFQSSLMTSIALHGRAPYRTVITHGFVVDQDTKKKVSKSDQGQGGYKKPMEADYFVNKYGADIVRLWAGSTQFLDDVPFSEENFARIGDAYRSFRNVLRVLLANLDGFDRSTADAALAGATAIDRWMLSRLQDVIATCRAAYESYDFRAVFQTLANFTANELSSIYVDVTKDRMYCDAANSPRRRATQAVMHRVVDAVARLLAPILAYTADEVWEFTGQPDSVHLELFPTADSALRDEALEARIQRWLALRATIAQAVEPARQAKTLGNNLEAAVTLEIADAAELTTLQTADEEAREFFILSDLTLAAGAETRATVKRTGFHKCGRCWRHLPTVSADGELCDRCASVVAG